MYSVMWSEHCSYKSSKIYLRQFGRKVTDKMTSEPHGRHGRERRRRRHRRRLGGHLQDREPQPPELHRAVPGRRDRRRRHRARHHLDGRAPGRGHGCAALRRRRRPRHGPGRARRRARHQLLRQLPGPAQHRRRDLVRPGVPGQPARQRARRRRAAARGPAPGQRQGRRQQGRAVRGAHRRRRHRRRIDPRLATASARAARPSDPPCRSATPSPRRCSSSAASSCSRATSSRASRTSAPPASRCATSELASNGDGGMYHRAREGAAARPVAHAPRRSSCRRARSA